VVSRSAETELHKRVHLIWLCIKAPHSGGRALETGDEELLKLAIELKIPVVVVFTQFDTFKMGVAARARKETAEKKAELVDTKFNELCLKPLHKIDHNLRHAKTSGLSKGHVNPDYKALIQLVQKSLDLVGRDGSGDAWIISAMAQRVSAEMKIHACIKIGMKRYWENLALNPYFARSTREECLNTMHREVTDNWNFDDPEDLLIGPKFTDQIKAVAQLVTPNEGEAKSLFESLEGAEMLIGVATAVLAPAVFAIGTTAWFAKFAQGVYQSTPETLRCFMAYLVDLILVLHELFLVVAIRPPRPLTDADVDKAFENYKKSGLGRVHRDIRQYVSEANWNKILFERTAAEAKVKELILTYSSGNEAFDTSNPADDWH